MDPLSILVIVVASALLVLAGAGFGVDSREWSDDPRRPASPVGLTV
jgi:hypothetical protein